MSGHQDPAGLPQLDDTCISAGSLAAVEGHAFCFLPLPVVTGLPLHINAFFELSSNRRDIWYGSDLTGAGKLRSDWNVCLLEVRHMTPVLFCIVHMQSLLVAYASDISWLLQSTIIYL